MDGEEQKQANKGNFQLTFVTHERLGLGSIFSILALFYKPRKDLEALSFSNKIDKTGYRGCRYY